MQPMECPEPFCVLQRDGMDRETLLSEFVPRLLAGEVLSQLRPPAPAEHREVCAFCVKQVVAGEGPLHWGKQFEEDIAGWRTHRRERRRRTREERS